jgi:pimeloyl-ACP methyl ester carboxylesterase
MLKPEFVEIKTKDSLNLPGLLYEVENSKAVAIFLHGNGSSSIFYNTFVKSQPTALALAKRGISILYFNNRGAHIVKSLYKGSRNRGTKKRYGMAYEIIKECILDIDGAVSYLKGRGYNKFYLIGASTGANKICVYNFYKPKNQVSKYVLLCGGDDTGIYYNLLGKAAFWALLSKARKKIDAKKGEEIIPEMLPENIFSYIGFYDIANPDGDYNVFPFYEAINKVKLSKKPLFRYFKSIKKQTLVAYGEKDEYAWGGMSQR